MAAFPNRHRVAGCVEVCKGLGGSGSQAPQNQMQYIGTSFHLAAYWHSLARAALQNARTALMGKILLTQHIIIWPRMCVHVLYTSSRRFCPHNVTPCLHTHQPCVFDNTVVARYEYTALANVPRLRYVNFFWLLLYMYVAHYTHITHRFQLSRNLRDSPGFVASVPDHGRPYCYPIVCPGCWRLVIVTVMHTACIDNWALGVCTL